MVPACCQGVLALEVKEGSHMLEIISQIENKEANERLRLERLYLQTIGGTCHEPIGCHIENNTMYAIFGNEDGSYIVTSKQELSGDVESQIKDIALSLKAEVEMHG